MGVGVQLYAPGRFTPRKDLGIIVQDAGWAPGPVWTGAENLDPRTVQAVAKTHCSAEIAGQAIDQDRCVLEMYCS